MGSRFLCVVVCGAALALASCGGGDRDVAAERLAAAPMADVGDSGSTAAMVVRPLSQRAPTTATAAVDATAFMDWAELAFPMFFPSFQADRRVAAYTFRYYPESDAYIAITGDSIFLLGSAFGGRLVPVGKLADFTCNVFPEACVSANAGPDQNVTVGTTVTLDATGSTTTSPRGLTYAWTLMTKPSGSAAVLSASAVARPTFRADVAGQYVVRLIAADEFGTSAPATVTITASSANSAPVARAGTSQTTLTGGIVFLNGSSSSDANGDPLTYAWTFSQKPAGSTATLTGASTVAPSFRADVAGTYIVSLKVNDGKVSSAESLVVITATPQTPVVTTNTSSCCRVCTTGKACGDACISRTLSCSKSGGCAC